MLFRRAGASSSGARQAEFCARAGAPKRARNAGKWLAGYISYEAGYLFEPKLAPLAARRAAARRLMCLRRLRRTVATLARAERRRRRPTGRSSTRGAAWTFDDYEQRFDRLHQHLRQGDCYQGNLTLPIHAQLDRRSARRLRRADRAPAGKIRRAGRARRSGRAVALAGTVLRDRRGRLDRDASDEGHRPRGATKPRTRRSWRSACATIRRTRRRTA